MEISPKKHFFSDVHIHLQDPQFGKSWEEVERYVERAKNLGITRMVSASTSPADWNRTAELAERFDSAYACFGVHPWYVRKISGDWLPILESFLINYVAKNGSKPLLGEVGLDAAVNEYSQVEKKMQEDALRGQLEIANSLGIPVVVHSVRANDRILKMMKEFPKVPAWLMHGWIATQDEIEAASELGAFFSFSKRSTAPRAVKSRATITAAPRDKILLESDGPRLLPPTGYNNSVMTSPEVYLQFRNADGLILEDSSSMLDAAKEICAIRKVSEEDFFEQLEINERRFFRSIPQKSA